MCVTTMCGSSVCDIHCHAPYDIIVMPLLPHPLPYLGLIPPRGPATSTEKYHPNIKMLSLDDCDRDSSSPEDMEQWRMPTGTVWGQVGSGGVRWPCQHTCSNTLIPAPILECYRHDKGLCFVCAKTEMQHVQLCTPPIRNASVGCLRLHAGVEIKIDNCSDNFLIIPKFGQPQPLVGQPFL